MKSLLHKSLEPGLLVHVHEIAKLRFLYLVRMRQSWKVGWG